MSTSFRLGSVPVLRALAVVTASALLLTLGPALRAQAQTTPPDRTDLEFACPDEEVPDDSGFTDIAGNNFEGAIECLVYYGVTTGVTATTYEPFLTVNRAQMATFFARLVDYAELNGLTGLPDYDGTNDFTDVGDPTHLESINRLSQAGIVQGGPGGLPETQYGPGQPVNRAQMASFINRVQGYLQGEDLDGDAYGFATDDTFFPDLAGTAPHTDNINAIASVGITQGDTAGNYNPGNSTVRG